MHRHTPERCALRLHEIQTLAHRQGGRCLSNQYVTRQTPMTFECAEGHRWDTRPAIILDDGWCPECRYRPPSGVLEMQALARERGGECLSDTYVANPPGMRWRCAKGHEWSVTPKQIRRGTWCPDCARAERRTLADMQALAARHGGTCVAKMYIGHDTPLQWACALGHRFAIRPRCVRAGQWCPTCNRSNTAWPRALARALAQGGVCLARGRTTSDASVRWRCAQGHVWTSSAKNVANGRWCQRCSGRLLGIEHMHAHAATRSGRCLSKHYVDSATKLQWECEYGHRWWSRPANVRGRGTWCPECAWDQAAERARSEARDRR